MGQLVQLQQFEEKQLEWSKRPSKLDITMQDEDINPMAPSSQDVSESSSRKK